jgi:hypothetical protein
VIVVVESCVVGHYKMKKFKIAYTFFIFLLIAISLLFFKGNNITGFFVSPTNAPAGANKQAYKAVVDSYTPTWKESDCYSLFEIDEDSFDIEASNQVYQQDFKLRLLEENTSEDYTSTSTFYLSYFYDKFSVCSLDYAFIIDNFTPVLFEQIKSDLSQEIEQDIEYKKIADFNCNNGKVSMVMWEHPNGALIRLTSYVLFPEDKVPGGCTAEECFAIKTNMNTIHKETLLLNGDKFAYFHYKIRNFLDNYCNPDLPTNITFTE